MDASGSIPTSTLAPLARDWPRALLIVFIALAVQFALYWPTVTSAVALWRTSSAYNYGFLIVPIALYLIWADRAAVRGMTPVQWLPGLGVSLAFGVLWYTAELLGVNEGRHFAFVGMTHGILLFALGWRIYRRLAFPFFYLWLLVPTGEFLIEPLQTFSRDSAVWLLKLSGIPVFTEGWTIEVPSGVFVVERGCAGLNFLLSSLALSLVYGKLNYSRQSARIVCVLTAIVVSLLANNVRVFLIVALTEWTNGKLDIADDHLLYGWAFFGLVMLACMWIGQRFAESKPKPPPPESGSPHRGAMNRGAVVFGAATLAAILAVFPTVSRATEKSGGNVAAIPDMPAEAGEWRLESRSERDWRPRLSDSDGSLIGVYRRGTASADVVVSYFTAQHDRHEAAAPENQAMDPTLTAAGWHQSSPQRREISIGGQRRDMAVIVLESHVSGRHRGVMYWYESAGCLTASRLKAKLCSARVRLLGRAAAGAFVAMSIESEGSDENIFEFLGDLAAHWPATTSLTR